MPKPKRSTRRHVVFQVTAVGDEKTYIEVDRLKNGSEATFLSWMLKPENSNPDVVYCQGSIGTEQEITIAKVHKIKVKK